MKVKKIPMRTCVVTGEKYEKRELLRIVKDKDGNLSVDETGKMNGRGAYIKKDLEVLNLAKKNKALEKNLECNIPDFIYEEIEAIINKN